MKMLILSMMRLNQKNEAFQEQKVIKSKGGIDKLDNKIRAQNEKTYKSLEPKYGKTKSGSGNPGTASASLKNKPKLSVNKSVTRSLGKGTTKSIFLFSILDIIIDSPNSSIYMFHSPGGGLENRAYPTNAGIGNAQYYEWSYRKDSEGNATKIRNIKYYDDYEFRDGEWRGKGEAVGSDVFDEEGKKLEMY